MAIGDYRFRLRGTNSGGTMPEVTMRGMVKFDVWVEVSVDAGPPEVWQLVDGGHFTESIAGTALEQAQNSGQVLNYIAQQIAAKGLVQSDRARRVLMSFLPNEEWPAYDITRSIDVG